MPIGVSMKPFPFPALVRANSRPPLLFVLKIAQGSAPSVNVWPNPACCDLSPEKLAENSRECGGVKIADAAMHELPKGFPGFKVSPAAFLIDGIQNNRTPPDWWFAHEKKLEREQWEESRAIRLDVDESPTPEYLQARSVAFQEYCRSEEGSAVYEKTFLILLAFHKVTDPHSAPDAARKATLTRMERENFQFPEFASWSREGK